MAAREGVVGSGVNMKLTFLWGVGAGAALLLFGAGAVAAPPRSSTPEALVPANMQPQTDDKGNQWSLSNYGFLQNTGNSFFNNILMLHVNGQQFYNYQPQMTSDGKEFVLHAQQPLMGLQITRRVRLLEKEGIMRYVDVFQNPGTASITATAEYRNNFSSPLKSVVTDRGVLNPGTLAKGETGVVISSKQNAQRAVAFVLGPPHGGLRPSFSQRGQYECHFSFALTVPPGQSVSLAYAAAIVPPPPEKDPAALGKLFKSVAAAKFLKSIRREELALLANFAVSVGAEPAAFLSSQGVGSLDLERGKSDVLALGDKTRLTGTASSTTFSVTTPMGAVTVPFENVAAVTGGARAAGSAKIFLRDGQVFSGEVKAEDFRFAMPSGARVDLDLGSLDRLVRAPAAEEGKWDKDTVAMLVTYQGAQLALAAGDARFECTTPWGPLSFTLDDLKWFAPSDEGLVGHLVEFKDGSRFFGFMSGPPVTAPTRLFGPQTFSTAQLRGVVTAAALAKGRTGAEEDEGLSRPHLVLAGNQLLPGQIEAESLDILTGSKIVQVPPSGIRSLRNVSEEVATGELEGNSPPFEIELWGGGVMVGQLREPVLGVRVRDALWRVPAGDIVEFNNPAPRLSDEVRLRITGLLRDLGSEDWEKREAASQSLAELGFLARPLLEECLKTTPDPEVRHRVEKLLDGME